MYCASRDRLNNIKECLRTVLQVYFRQVRTVGTGIMGKISFSEFADAVVLSFKRVLCYKKYRRFIHSVVYDHCTRVLRKVLRKCGYTRFFKRYALETIGMLQYLMSNMCRKYAV